MDLDKVRRKVSQVRDIEGRKLLQEALLSYVGFLVEKWRRADSEICRYLYMLYVYIPITLVSLEITAIIHVHEIGILYCITKSIVMLLATICTVILIVIYVRACEYKKLEREIYEIYDIIIDPIMRRESREALKDPRVIVAIVLTAIAIACAVIAWLI